VGVVFHRDRLPTSIMKSKLADRFVNRHERWGHGHRIGRDFSYIGSTQTGSRPKTSRGLDACRKARIRVQG
jgi:hypothetical protein